MPGNPVSDDGAANTMVGAQVPDSPLRRYLTDYILYIKDKYTSDI